MENTFGKFKWLHGMVRFFGKIWFITREYYEVGKLVECKIDDVREGQQFWFLTIVGEVC